MAHDAYIAGFFDGEGSLVRYGKGKRYWRVCIYQNNPEPLEEIRDTLGFGRVKLSPMSSQLTTHYTGYRLYVTKAAEVLEFLERTLPHLIVKRGKAEEAIPELRARLENMSRELV